MVVKHINNINPKKLPKTFKIISSISNTLPIWYWIASAPKETIKDPSKEISEVKQEQISKKKKASLQAQEELEMPKPKLTNI